MIPITEDEEDERLVELLVVDESGGSILKPFRGCRQSVIGVHLCPGCSAYKHLFCGDEVDEGGPG